MNLRVALVCALVIVAPACAQKFNKAGMPAAQAAAGQLMRDWLAFTAPAELAVLEAAQADEVTVVNGHMDHLQEVLASAGIPFTLVEAHTLKQGMPARHHIVMVNCPGEAMLLNPGVLPEFARRGGWVLTTDWALKVLEQDFPGYVKCAVNDQQEQVMTGDEVVPVKLYDDLHPLVRGVMAQDSAARWWLEGASYPISIVNRDQVRVLLHSPEMLAKYGYEAIAVHFEYGVGTVFHLTSHVALQRADHAGSTETAAQYIQNQLAGKEVSPAAAAAVIPRVSGVTRGELEAAYTIMKFLARIIVENRSRE